jgi:hypothetical protein
VRHDQKIKPLWCGNPEVLASQLFGQGQSAFQVRRSVHVAGLDNLWMFRADDDYRMLRQYLG